MTEQSAAVGKAQYIGTAAATMSILIVTLADAKARIEHHKQGLTEAWSNYYPGAKILIQGNDQQPHHVLEGTCGDAALFFMAIRKK